MHLNNSTLDQLKQDQTTLPDCVNASSKMDMCESSPGPSKATSSCFVCDEKVVGTIVPLLTRRTKHSKTSLQTKIGQVMGDEFMVVAANEDFVCDRCYKLLNLFDKLQTDVKTVKQELKSYMNVKYHLDDSSYHLNNVVQEDVQSNDSSQIGKIQTQNVKARVDSSEGLLPVKMYKCKYCNYTSSTKSVLIDHLKSHPKSIYYKCSKCHMRFNCRSDIEVHISQVHQLTPSVTDTSRNCKSGVEPELIHRKYKCGLCFVTYTAKSDLIKHFDTHRNTSNIDDDLNISMGSIPAVQGKSDGNSVNLKSEQSVHLPYNDSEKKQVTNTLPTAFQHQPCNNIELQEHSDMVSYKDTNCLREVKVEPTVSYEHSNLELPGSNLLKQMEGQLQIVVGTASEQQTNSTEVDFSEMKSKDEVVVDNVNPAVRKYVKIKMKPQSEADVKSNVKIFVCSVCNIRSPSEVRMKRHIKGHIALSKKIHTCHICGKLLTTRSNLKRHISNHISDPVKCQVCSEEVTDRLHLKQHLETLHPLTYHCTVCKECFKTKHLLRNHEFIHKDLQQFLCTNRECREVFLTEIELKNHQSSKHGVVHTFFGIGSKMFKCYVCHKILSTYHNLKRHLINHSKFTVSINCSVCKEKLSGKMELQQHFAENHPETYQCGFCSKIFTNKKIFKSHELSHPERLFYKCTNCEKVFPNERQLNCHKDTIHREPRCRYCSKEICNRKKLIQHEKRHEKHKHLYPCSDCNKVFRTPSGLRYHMSVHTGEYNFHCEVCNRGFHSEVVLAEHKATHTKEIRYTCDRCGRNFTSNSTLRLHRIWHDNPFPYTCNICNRKFRHTSILAVHKRRAHTGERPYKCPHCSFTFNISSTLNKHLILHTKEYPHICKVCTKGFTTRSKIARHMEKVHNDPTMLNEKRKPCEYKMMLRPEEYSETASMPEEFLENTAYIDVTQVNKGQEENCEGLQHINIVAVNPSHTMFTLF